ncbi:MAG: glycosyltransferase [Clostridiales bacterium]|nr:MAG: glycosyltransferase [Clostridiales bacterium]
MTVSLGIIAYNEEKYLNNIFKDLCAQDFDHSKIEVVLINSASTDNTNAIMEDFAARNEGFMSVKVLENPKKTLPCGWNVFINESEGDLLIKWDAHASFPPDFITASVRCIESGEDVCGGIRPCIVDENTPYKNTLLLAENSLFGSSFAPYRRNTGKEYVKSVFHGTYKREALIKIGGFDERLTRTEDNDIHYRLRKNGYKICFDNKIQSKQLIRASFSKMLKQKYANGKWIGLTTAVQPKCLELYHFVPFCFIVGIVLTTILACFGIWQLAALMWALYGILDIAMSAATIIRNKHFHISQLLLPIMFLLLHIAYGIGTVVGFVKIPFWKEKKHE